MKLNSPQLALYPPDEISYSFTDRCVSLAKWYLSGEPQKTGSRDTVLAASQSFPAHFDLRILAGKLRGHSQCSPLLLRPFLLLVLSPVPNLQYIILYRPMKRYVRVSNRK